MNRDSFKPSIGISHRKQVLADLLESFISTVHKLGVDPNDVLLIVQNRVLIRAHPTPLPDGDTPMGVNEVAKYIGVKPPVFCNWIHRKVNDVPEPYTTLRQGRIWLKKDIAAWWERLKAEDANRRY